MKRARLQAEVLLIVGVQTVSQLTLCIFFSSGGSPEIIYLSISFSIFEGSLKRKFLANLSILFIIFEGSIFCLEHGIS